MLVTTTFSVKCAITPEYYGIFGKELKLWNVSRLGLIPWT